MVELMGWALYGGAAAFLLVRYRFLLAVGFFIMGLQWVSDWDATAAIVGNYDFAWPDQILLFLGVGAGMYLANRKTTE